MLEWIFFFSLFLFLFRFLHSSLFLLRTLWPLDATRASRIEKKTSTRLRRTLHGASLSKRFLFTKHCLLIQLFFFFFSSFARLLGLFISFHLNIMAHCTRFTATANTPESKRAYLCVNVDAKFFACSTFQVQTFIIYFFCRSCTHQAEVQQKISCFSHNRMFSVVSKMGL